MKKHNSLECVYGGYKLSSFNVDIDVKASTEIDTLCIGSDDDDSFYENSGKSGRIKLYVGTQLDIVEIDLEDILVFARKNCAGIYKRVFEEVEETKE